MCLRTNAGYYCIGLVNLVSFSYFDYFTVKSTASGIKFPGCKSQFIHLLTPQVTLPLFAFVLFLCVNAAYI